MSFTEVLAAVLIATTCTTAGGQAGTTTGGATSTAAGTAKTAKTVELTLIAGKTDANGTFNFNGYSNAKMMLTVPVGWTVVIHYQNHSALRHSLDVIPYTGKQPDSAPRPAFGGASTKDLVGGIGVGREETIRFVVNHPGRYEFLCGVLGHALAGMWNYLVVSPTAAAPAVRPNAAAALKTR